MRTQNTKKVFALPLESRLTVLTCVSLQAWVLYLVLNNPHINPWGSLFALLASMYIMDLITAFVHFGFDYVWPDNMPIMGPISVEFREHHHAPMLDPSALLVNYTKSAYGAIPLTLIAAYIVSKNTNSSLEYFYAATAYGVCQWALFFHQVHSYTHMGKTVPPEEFNAAVEVISKLPRSQQPKEFAKLFERAGIPKWVRFCQRCRIFLRPEIHWRHHNSFDSDFSSLNGWSDSLTNLFFGPIARYKMAKENKNAQKMPSTPCATQKIISEIIGQPKTIQQKAMD